MGFDNVCLIPGCSDDVFVSALGVCLVKDNSVCVPRYEYCVRFFSGPVQCQLAACCSMAVYESVTACTVQKLLETSHKLHPCLPSTSKLLTISGQSST